MGMNVYLNIFPPTGRWGSCLLSFLLHLWVYTLNFEDCFASWAFPDRVDWAVVTAGFWFPYLEAEVQAGL